MPSNGHRFSDNEIFEILSHSRRETVAATAARHRVTAQAIYNWRRRYDGLACEEFSLARWLERETTRLGKALDDRHAEIEWMRLLLGAEPGQCT